MILSNQSQKPIIAVIGPTASGKSALGIELALRLRGEIINCDSVQVYREIEIATAKVHVSEQRGVPHHLINFVPPEINYTAGEWARAAREKIEEIEARGRVALIVGGTGFYLRALRQPFFPGPPTNFELRQRLTELRARRGPAHLHRILQRLDPTSAAKLHPHDWSRVQRALEVRLQTGLLLSAQQSERAAPHPSVSRIQLIALQPPRAELYRRIDARTEQHFQAGLIEEVRRLLAQGVPADSNALGAHGYRRVVEYLRGARSFENAVEHTKLDVRHYAKRQLTWFRREPDAHPFEGFGDDPRIQERVAAHITRVMSDER